MDQAERLRSIVKAQNVSLKPNARLITVTSGKGGVGKSSVAINLAVQFRKLGYSVIIFDADFGLANIEVMFGAIPKYNLSDLIYRGKRLEDVIDRGPMDIGFISGGSGIAELSSLTRENVRYLISKLVQLETMADIIIVDTGAGISETVMEFVLASREVILVTTPEPTSITDAYALLKILKRNEKYKPQDMSIKVIANKTAAKQEGEQLFEKLKSVVEKFLEIDLQFLGSIPHDRNVSNAIMQQRPVSIAFEKSKASEAFIELARTLTEEVDSNYQGKTGIAQIFMNIFRNKIK